MLNLKNRWPEICFVETDATIMSHATQFSDEENSSELNLIRCIELILIANFQYSKTV